MQKNIMSSIRKRNHNGEFTVEQDYKPSLNDLPAEILFKVLEYVNFKDIQCLARTCRRMNRITNTSHFLSKTLLKFKNILLIDDEMPILTFLQSSRIYEHLHIKCCRLGILNNFLEKFGKNITTLVIEDLSLCENLLIHILESLPNLQSLEMNNCFFYFTTNTRDLPNYLPKLQKLCIIQSMHIDIILSVIFPILKNLKEFSMSNCEIDKESEYYFSPETRNNTLKVVIIVEHLASELTELNIDLNSYEYEQIQFEDLSDIKNLKLKKFVSCPGYDLDLRKFEFIMTQTSLTSLNLSHVFLTQDSMINLICEKLCALESLNLYGIKGITNASIVNLSKLENLKELNVSGCLNINAYGLFQGIALQRNEKFRVLKMQRINATVYTIIQIVQNMPNLRKLDVSYCKNGLKNTSVQAIFKCCKFLTHLDISGSEWVNDAGLTGISPKYIIKSRVSINELKGLRWLNISDCKQITNKSWERFVLSDLIYINISHPISFSVGSIEILLKNCPSIERLIVSGITYRHANVIFGFSKRLRHLAGFELGKWDGRSISTKFCGYNCCVEKRAKRQRTKTSFYGIDQKSQC